MSWEHVLFTADPLCLGRDPHAICYKNGHKTCEGNSQIITYSHTYLNMLTFPEEKMFGRKTEIILSSITKKINITTTVHSCAYLKANTMK